MSFLEKLDYLMARERLNKHTLSQQSGIPYTTIVGFYERSYENTKLSTVQKLAEFFGVSLDYLMRDQYTNPYDSPTSLTQDEIRLLDQYRDLSDEGKRYIRQTMNIVERFYGPKQTE
jgi:transcriptional regulator with XRE-family HTH domain